MKRLVLLLALLCTCLGLFSNVAEAIGSGDSLGEPRILLDNTVNHAPITPRGPTPGRGSDAPGPSSGWLTGLAPGAMLAQLLSGNRLHNAPTIILLALLAAGALAWGLARGRKPAPRPSASDPVPVPDRWQAPTSHHASVIALARASGNAPDDFPLQSFLRSGKATFIRLHEASDRLDLDDIREYTTPQMFAELSLQLLERGDMPQRTDILALHAELLEVVTEGDISLANVRFTGSLRTNKGEPQPLDEVWHVQMDLRDRHGSLLLAGIQQVTLH